MAFVVYFNKAYDHAHSFPSRYIPAFIQSQMQWVLSRLFAPAAILCFLGNSIWSVGSFFLLATVLLYSIFKFWWNSLGLSWYWDSEWHFGKTLPCIIQECLSKFDRLTYFFLQILDHLLRHQSVWDVSRAWRRSCLLNDLVSLSAFPSGIQGSCLGAKWNSPRQSISTAIASLSYLLRLLAELKLFFLVCPNFNFYLNRKSSC